MTNKLDSRRAIKDFLASSCQNALKYDWYETVDGIDSTDFFGMWVREN